MGRDPVKDGDRVPVRLEVCERLAKRVPDCVHEEDLVYDAVRDVDGVALEVTDGVRDPEAVTVGVAEGVCT